MTQHPRQKKIHDLCQNYEKTLKNLTLSIQTPIKENRDLSGIIKDFELAYELGWKVLKLYLEIQGHQPTSARDSFKMAYQFNFIKEEKIWLNMIEDRNNTVHTYNEKVAVAIVERIKKDYQTKLQELFDFIEEKI